MLNPSRTDLPFAPPLTENEIQRAVFANLRQRGAPGIVAFHPKNGGSHQRGRRAGINSGLGVLAGIPDVIVIHRGHVFALELKTESTPKKKGGELKPEQERVLIALREAGASATHAHGLDQALAILTAWGLLKGTVT